MNNNVFEYRNIEDIITQGQELDVIEYCGFEVIKNKDDTYSLHDLEGANLAGICDVAYESYKSILNRLDGSYLHDYRILNRHREVM